MNKIKKVIILGSGALKIGEAGEFDYSGSQATKALKEEGIQTIVVNPNIATIQTSRSMADKIYFLPVTPYFVEKVIIKEKPDGILLSFGGQTALNCGVELFKKKIFDKYKVKVLGTPVESIILTEDRKKFADHLLKIHQPIPKSKAATSIDEALAIVDSIGYPVMTRAAYALGGFHSGVSFNREELIRRLSETFSFSKQVLVEQYLHHFKEIEYEVVRDSYDNCITVCNMENFDPLGIHTGESIVIAPSQTLTNFEYHELRKVSIEIIRSLGIIGECNIQFALNPNPLPSSSLDFYIIEVNARLSRSSALASKATGYPLAYVAAKLALGKKLSEVKNQITQVTQSFFEPALDYVVVKIPRWDIEKFKGANEKIGSSMKSVGEVMGIGRKFEEAIQKAVRMLEIGCEGITDNRTLYGFSGDDRIPSTKEILEKYVEIPTPRRLFAITEALRRGINLDKIYKMTGIDKWFLYRIKYIVDAEQIINKKISKEGLLNLKQLGFSDKRIAYLLGVNELAVRSLRLKNKILPAIFQIDTLAGEVPAKTNYLYLTYNGSHHDVEPLKKDGVMVLGSGPYRIGSSVEFDWSCVQTALSLKKYQKKSIIVNCNPETVSTDYDISDRLYFEELTFERITDIYEFEKSSDVIISVGGQTPNNLVGKLANKNIPIMGTSAQDIDRAENRNKFSHLLDKLAISQPEWVKATSIISAIKFANKVGYPILVRPSYVLSGAAMNLCHNEDELVFYTKKATVVNKEYPVTLSKFFAEAKEIELDAVAQKGEVMISAISEHIEHAGVHSGDATIVYPSQNVYLRTENEINKIASLLAKELNVIGPFNIQFLARENIVYVIEMNIRASRTFPFISKATGVNFATKIVDSYFNNCQKVNLDYPDHVVVKSSQFSFSRLDGADPVLRVEMTSTGEVGCFGDDVEEAFLKSELSVGAKLPQKGIFLSLGGLDNKVRFLESALRLKKLNLPIFATEKTANFLKINGIKTKRLYKIHEAKRPNILDYFQRGKVDLAINLTDVNLEKDVDDYYVIRRATVDHNIYLLTNRQKAALFTKALVEKKYEDLKIKEREEYFK